MNQPKLSSEEGNLVDVETIQGTVQSPVVTKAAFNSGRHTRLTKDTTTKKKQQQHFVFSLPSSL